MDNNLVMEIEDYWRSRWWEKPVWRSQLTQTDSQIHEAIELLQKEFDASWYSSISHPAGHPVSLKLMIGEGIHSLRGLLDTARQIRSLRGVHGFGRVLREFKTERNWQSAHIEMLMGYAFKDESADVEYIVPKSKKGPTPDILVRSQAGPFTIECKRLEEAKGEQWIDRFSRAYFEEFHGQDFDGLHIYAHPNNPYLKLSGTGFPNNPRNPREYARDMAAPVLKRLRCMKANGRIDSFLQTDTHFLALLTPAYRSLASVMAPGLETRFLMRRLMSNVSRAASQIRAYANQHGVSGILAVWQAEPCEYEYLHNRLSREMVNGKHDYILGIMVMKMDNILAYQRPLWVRNPLKESTPQIRYIEGILSRKFSPFGIDMSSDHKNQR